MKSRTNSDEGPAAAGPSSLSVRLGLGPRAATTAALTALTAATAVVLNELLRTLFPLLYHFAEEIGFLTAAGLIPLIFLTPYAVSLVSAALGTRGALAATAGILFAVRLAMQAGFPTLAIAATGSMAGFAALAMLVEAFRRHGRPPPAGASGSRFGGLAFVGGLLAGLLADTVNRLAHITWDPAWQSGLWSWVACGTVAGLGAALLVAVVRAMGPSDPDTRVGDAFAVAALGPFLALELLVLASPAFAASSGRLSLPVAGLMVLLGLVAGFGVLAAPCRRGPLGAMTVAAGGALAAIMGGLTGAYAVSGIWAAAGLITGQALAVWLLALAFQTVTHRHASGHGSGAWRGGIGAGTASVLFVAVLLPYQIHYELPLPFSNRVLPAMAALVLGLLAVRSVRLTGCKYPLRNALAGCGAALVAGAVPLALALTAPAAAGGPPEGTGGGDGSFRLVSYNIHEAVNVNGHLDPESIAAVIESQDADVVALQEVGRGWPLSAAMDVGAWLARRLDMRLIYGPAADRQFGNAILTDLPVGEVAHGRLPQGSGSMVRGYVMAEISVGDEQVEVWTTHLQHHDGTTRTRIAEIDELLGVWDGAAPAVLTGDMNARPPSAEMSVWFNRTDLRSAQDVTGHSALPTCCWPDIDHRIDWILGTPDVRFSGFSIPRTTASDHLPQAVTVTVSK